LHQVGTDVVKQVQVAAVSAKDFQFFYSGYNSGILYSDFCYCPSFPNWTIPKLQTPSDPVSLPHLTVHPVLLLMFAPQY